MKWLAGRDKKVAFGVELRSGGAETRSTDRACADLSPIVGSNDNTTASTKTSDRLFHERLQLRRSTMVFSR
jgi:hypothetical protein